MADPVGRLIARLKRKYEKFSSENVRKALTLIGVRIQADTVLNIRRRGLVDKGRLINSVRYELYKSGNSYGVRVGSFGVPYASVHEFGFNGTVNMRAYARTMNTVYGRKVDPRKILIRAHKRNMRIPARPYLRPAVRTNTNYIIESLREAMRE